MCQVLDSRALFLPSFFWKSSPGARRSFIPQSRPHLSAAGRYNWHSQKSLQDSCSMALPLSSADFDTLPPPPHSVSCQAQSRCRFTPGNLEMKKKKKRRISTSKFRVQEWNGIFSYPISFSSYHVQLSNTILCKAVSGSRMCTWRINQLT